MKASTGQIRARIGLFFKTLSEKFSKGEVLTSAIVIAYDAPYGVYEGRYISRMSVQTKVLEADLCKSYST